MTQFFICKLFSIDIVSYDLFIVTFPSLGTFGKNKINKGQLVCRNLKKKMSYVNVYDKITSYNILVS